MLSHVLIVLCVFLCVSYANEEFYSHIFDYYLNHRDQGVFLSPQDVVVDAKHVDLFERQVEGHILRWGVSECVSRGGGCSCTLHLELEGAGRWMGIGFPTTPGEMSGDGVIGWQHADTIPAAVQVDQGTRSGRQIAQSMRTNAQTFVKKFNVRRNGSNLVQSVDRDWDTPLRACTNLGTMPQLWSSGTSIPRSTSVTPGIPLPLVQGLGLNIHGQRGSITVDQLSSQSEIQKKKSGTFHWPSQIQFWLALSLSLVMLLTYLALYQWAHGSTSFWTKQHFENVSIQLGAHHSEYSIPTPISASQRAKQSMKLMDVGKRAADATQCPPPQIQHRVSKCALLVKKSILLFHTALHYPQFTPIAICLYKYVIRGDISIAAPALKKTDPTLFSQQPTLQTKTNSISTVVEMEEKSFVTPRLSMSRSQPHGLSQQELMEESVDEVADLKSVVLFDNDAQKRTLQDYLDEYPTHRPHKAALGCCSGGREARKYKGLRRVAVGVRNVLSPIFRMFTLHLLLIHIQLLALAYIPAHNSKNIHTTLGMMTLCMYSMTILFPNRGNRWFEWQTQHRAAARLALALVLAHYLTNTLGLSPFGLAGAISLALAASVALLRSYHYSLFLFLHTFFASTALVFIILHQTTLTSVVLLLPSVLIRILSYSTVCCYKQHIEAVVLAQGDATFVHNHTDTRYSGKLIGLVEKQNSNAHLRIALPGIITPTLPSPYCMVTLSSVTSREKPFTLITGGLVPAVSSTNTFPVGQLKSSKVDVPSNLTEGQHVSIRYSFPSLQVAGEHVQGSVFSILEGILTRCLIRAAMKQILQYKDNIISISQLKQVQLRGEIHSLFLPGFTFDLEALATMLYHVLTKEEDDILPLSSDSHLVGGGQNQLENKCSGHLFLIKATNLHNTAPSRIHALHEQVTNVHSGILYGSSITARLWSTGLRNRYEAKSARHEHTVALHSCSETACLFPELARPDSAANFVYVGSKSPMKIGTQQWQLHDAILQEDNIFLFSTGVGITPVLGMIARCAAAMSIARGQAEEALQRQWQIYVCLKSTSVDFMDSSMDCQLDQLDQFTQLAKTYITGHVNPNKDEKKTCNNSIPMLASAQWLSKRVMVAWYCSDQHLLAYVVEKLASQVPMAYTKRDAIIIKKNDTSDPIIHDNRHVSDETWDTHTPYTFAHQHYAVNSVYCGARYTDFLDSVSTMDHLTSVQYGLGMIHVEVYYTGPHRDVLAGVAESQHSRETRVHHYYSQANSISRKATIHTEPPLNKLGGIHIILTKPNVETAMQELIPTVLTVKSENFTPLQDETELYQYPLHWNTLKFQTIAQELIDPLAWLRTSIVQPPICLSHALITPLIEINSISSAQWLQQFLQNQATIFSPKLYTLPANNTPVTPRMMVEQ